MKLHVLQLAAHLPPRYQGGAELYTANLIAELASRETVTALFIGDRDRQNGPPVTETRYRENGVDCVELSLHREQQSWPEYYFYNPHIAAAIRATLIRIKPDIVHVQGGFRLTAAALATPVAAGIPSIATLHDYYYLCPRVNLWTSTGNQCRDDREGANCPDCVSTPCSRSKDYMEDWMAVDAGGLAARLGAGRRQLLAALGMADHVLAPSAYLAGVYQTRGHIDAGRISVHRLGLPEAFRRARPASASLALRVAYIGHLRPHKGIETLLRAMIRLGQGAGSIKLTLYGLNPDTRDYAEKLTNRVSGHDNIVFAAEYPNHRLPALLEETDLVAVPSIWPENAPLVVTSALRMGVPVIASDIGGLPELVHHGKNGLLFPPDDDRMLAAQLAILAKDPQQRLLLARQASYPLTTADEVTSLCTLYHRLVESRRTGALP